MEESLAPAAERAYREAMSRRGGGDANTGVLAREGTSARVLARESYAILRVLDGRAVIEGVVVDGVSIEQAARAVQADAAGRTPP
jgi:hypothetical protein